MKRSNIIFHKKLHIRNNSQDELEDFLNGHYKYAVEGMLMAEIDEYFGYLYYKSENKHIENSRNGCSYKAP